MAANIGSGATRAHGATAEVNVTPFVDVMLVLLIIFMVAAPVATTAVPVNLTNTTPPPAVMTEPVLVSLQDTGEIFVGTRSSGEVRATWATLDHVLRQMTGGDLGCQVLVRADQKVSYADVMRLMDALHQHGYKNKTIVTEDVVD